MAITSLAELGKVLDLTEDEKQWKEDGRNTLPLLISSSMAQLLGIPGIRRQFVPDRRENLDETGNSDPLEEVRHSRTSRLVHRYRNRAVFLTTDRCFAYCRHCFRRRFTGTMTGPASDEEIAEAAAYLMEHREIKEVLLTGGDLFTLSDERLDYMLSVFKEAREDIIYRLCTRAVATEPSRFTDNLFQIIKKHQHGAPFYLMTHFNHPAELTAEAVKAVSGFLSLGIPALNQSVLLRGVNDDAGTLEELCCELLSNRIKPYYLFQGDLVQGTSHLRVDIRKGLEIEKELRLRLSGLAMPQYTIDLPQGGGKVILTEQHLIKETEDSYLFTTPEGDMRAYPKNKHPEPDVN